MKKLILLLLISLGFGLSVTAQLPPPEFEKEQRGQRIQALYVAYITKELKLTEEEAQKFWPVHAEFEAEMKTVKLDMPELDRQQAHLNIKKKYQDRFTKILGAARTDEFYKKDHEFRKRMMDRLRNIRQQRNERNGGPKGDRPGPEDF